MVRRSARRRRRPTPPTAQAEGGGGGGGGGWAEPAATAWLLPPFAGAGPAAQSGAVAAGALPPVAAVPNPLFTSCHRAQARLRGDVVRRLTANPPSRISCVQDQKESDGRAWSSEEAALT